MVHQFSDEELERLAAVGMFPDPVKPTVRILMRTFADKQSTQLTVEERTQEIQSASTILLQSFSSQRVDYSLAKHKVRFGQASVEFVRQLLGKLATQAATIRREDR